MNGRSLPVHTTGVESKVDVTGTSIHLGGNPFNREPPMTSDQQQRLIGYARVSTVEQELNLQIDALLAHGVKKAASLSATRSPEHAKIDQDWPPATRHYVPATHSSSGVSTDSGDQCVIS